MARTQVSRVQKEMRSQTISHNLSATTSSRFGSVARSFCKTAFCQATTSSRGYCRDIAMGLYPACVSSSTSETRIRLPFSISRPPQTRVSAAKYLPISIRAILMFSVDASLTLTRNLINLLRLNRSISDGLYFAYPLKNSGSAVKVQP